MHDLRSDTVTTPTEAMRAAMARAEVGDDVLGEDPTVRKLEERAAELFQREAALFVPSGTMGNQICLGTLTQPGDEIIAEAESHVLLNEVGGAARFWGCQITALAGTRGRMDLAAIEAHVRPPDIHHPRTTLLSLENTHNYGGGAVLDTGYLDAAVALARRYGLAVHLDGARLFNAQVASGVPVARLSEGADLVSVCLSKGLGAPVGSLVIGGAGRIESGRRLRKALGGGMRQAGVIAAAGLIALEEGPAALSDDHRRARALAEVLADLPAVQIDLEGVHTNIVIVETREPAADACRALLDHGVGALDIGERRLRFTFHRDAGDDALDAAITASRKVFSAGG